MALANAQRSSSRTPMRRRVHTNTSEEIEKGLAGVQWPNGSGRGDRRADVGGAEQGAGARRLDRHWLYVLTDVV